MPWFPNYYDDLSNEDVDEVLPKKVDVGQGGEREGEKAGEHRKRLTGKRMSKHLNLEHKLMIYQRSGIVVEVENYLILSYFFLSFFTNLVQAIFDDIYKMTSIIFLLSGC